MVMISKLLVKLQFTVWRVKTYQVIRYCFILPVKLFTVTIRMRASQQYFPLEQLSVGSNRGFQWFFFYFTL